jgi:hypothetical protein
MDKNSTPEERLLNLIRRKSQRQPVKSRSDFDDNVVEVDLLRSKQESPASNIFNLQLLNKLLIIACGLLVFYILFELLFFKNERSGVTATVPKGEEKNIAVEEGKTKPYSYYSVQFEQRDIFAVASMQSREATPVSTNADVQRLAQDLKLVGVILDNNPQAIIESKSENKTYFLHGGEIVGNFRVEVISESKVILSYGQEKIQLAI